MSKIIAIGEALIDFIPYEKGAELKDVQSFFRVPGGAPLNVASAVAKLGGKSKILTKLGEDSFAETILETVEAIGVDISSVKRTKEANTALAFVSLKSNGERDFSFYRNPSADMLLSESEIKEEDFNNGDILHFCSVSLIDAPIKKAHNKAIEYCIKHNGVVSFDPNIRLPLWKDPKDCKDAILEFIPKTNILKISDEELEFITGIKNEEEALKSLFVGNVALVIYTKGSGGADFITNRRRINSPCFKVQVEDTTGAGDSFIGSFLYQIIELKLGMKAITELNEEKVKKMLRFSNGTAALVVSKKGAIESLPDKHQVENFIKE